MEIEFIGQGYNMEANTCVATELIIALHNQNYNSFRCLVAFASYGGVSGLTEHIVNSKEFINDFKIIVGIDNKGTSKEALEEFLKWNVDVFVYHSTARSIFHPKVYFFEGDNEVLVIIGSNNFTEMGLSKNVESAVLIRYNKTEEDENHFLSKVKLYFNNLLEATQDNNLKRLTPELINRLHETGKLPSEIERERKHDSKYGTSGSDDNNVINELFSRAPIAKNPLGFKPKRIIRFTPVAEVVDAQENIVQEEGDTILEDNENWIGKENSPVLVAEIGGGSRWKQVNFPIKMFVNFFGATAGNNQYHINLRHVTSTRDLEDIENRQAVTVASQNYRFEIGAAIGAYPKKNRPICVFVRVAPRNFLYHLVLPSNKQIYPALNKFLIKNYKGPKRNLNRIQTSVTEVLKECENLPF